MIGRVYNSIFYSNKGLQEQRTKIIKILYTTTNTLDKKCYLCNQKNYAKKKKME